MVTKLKYKLALGIFIYFLFFSLLSFLNNFLKNSSNDFFIQQQLWEKKYSLTPKELSVFLDINVDKISKLTQSRLYSFLLYKKAKVYSDLANIPISDTLEESISNYGDLDNGERFSYKFTALSENMYNLLREAFIKNPEKTCATYFGLIDLKSTSVWAGICFHNNGPTPHNFILSRLYSKGSFNTGNDYSFIPEMIIYIFPGFLIFILFYYFKTFTDKSIFKLENFIRAISAKFNSS